MSEIIHPTADQIVRFGNGTLSSSGSANASVGRGMMRNVGGGIAARFGDGKPYDAEVGWLSSNGNQYIITDTILPVDASSFYFEAGFSFNTLNFYGEQTIISCWSDGNLGINLYFVSSGIGSFYFGLTGNLRQEIAISAGTYNIASCYKDSSNNRIYNQNGHNVYGSYLGSYLTPVNITLFCRADFTGVADAKIMYAKMIIDDELKFDMIPVVKNGIGYMYDRANPTGGTFGNGLYGNSGTGYFDFPGRIS